MKREDIEKWERYYEEAVQRDFAREIYKRCAEEDSRAAAPEPEGGSR
jgi:hypothetical protein